MTRRTIQVLAIIAAIAVVATASVTVMTTRATGNQAAASTSANVIHRLHGMMRNLHGGHDHQDPMAGLIERLKLTPEQLERFEEIQRIAGSYHRAGRGSMHELHEQLIARFEQGRVSTDEIRPVIDDHLETLREMAYAMTDQMIALVNDLDAAQREILLEYLQEGDRDHTSH